MSREPKASSTRGAIVAAAVLAACGGGLLPPDASDGGSDETSAFDAGADGTSPGDAGPGDATAPPCPPGEVLCENACFPNDVSHCGPNCATCSAPPFGTATCDGKSCGFKCNVLQCGASCVDPTSDQKNCGTCNHDCLNEACNGGVCTPEEIYPTVTPYGLTVDSMNLYWGTGSEVDQGPKVGGTWMAIAKNRNMIETTVRVDATNVYWSEDYSIATVPIGGGTVSKLAALTAQWPCIPTLGPQAIYTGDYANTSSLFAVPYDGGSPVALESTNQEILGTGYGASEVYFAAWAGTLPGMVWRANASAVDAGSELVFSHGAGFTSTPPFVVDDAGSAYAAMTDGVWAVPPDGGAAANIPITSPNILWLAMDGSSVYMASIAAIYRVPIGGKTPVTLYTAPTQNLQGIAIDDKYVYFSYAGNAGPGIYRMAK